MLNGKSLKFSTYSECYGAHMRVVGTRPAGYLPVIRGVGYIFPRCIRHCKNFMNEAEAEDTNGLCDTSNNYLQMQLTNNN